MELDSGHEQLGGTHRLCAPDAEKSFPRRPSATCGQAPAACRSDALRPHVPGRRLEFRKPLRLWRRGRAAGRSDGLGAVGTGESPRARRESEEPELAGARLRTDSGTRVAGSGASLPADLRASGPPARARARASLCSESFPAKRHSDGVRSHGARASVRGVAAGSGWGAPMRMMDASSGQPLAPSFSRRASRVAIRRAENYRTDLSALLMETLLEFDLPVRGKKVLLKPNFVGPDPLGVINTHPAVVAAARESFLRLGAERVLVGDGPALERDTGAVAETMRLREYVGPLELSFVDLNVDDVRRVPLRTRASSLRELYLPETVLDADLVVSMPKLQTHHWAGVTLSLKNMFGIVPGSCYGWPKNVLHWAGIGRSILDINAAARPDFAIVDGIMGMEGNGPIQGTPKAAGVLLFGDDPVSVDATACRVMGLLPEKVDYLGRAGTMLGHVEASKIQQLGEGIDAVKTPFAVLPEFVRLVA